MAFHGTKNLADRLNEEAGLAVPLAAGDDGRAFLLAALDVVHDSVVLRLRNLRTLVR